MKFRKIKQQLSEPIMDFYTRLKQGAALCGFTDKDKDIRHQLMSRTNDSKLRLQIIQYYRNNGDS